MRARVNVSSSVAKGPATSTGSGMLKSIRFRSPSTKRSPSGTTPRTSARMTWTESPRRVAGKVSEANLLEDPSRMGQRVFG
jgi:hypothetical protein